MKFLGFLVFTNLMICSSAKSTPGHILGSHKTRSDAHPERELNSLSCAVLRCLTHVCMYTGSLFYNQQVTNYIHIDILFCRVYIA